MTTTPAIHIAFDGVSGVDGSARFSFGHSTALASVSGPITARLAAEHPARATIDLHVRPLSSVPGTTEKHAAIALKGIFERACILAQHPRSLIQIVVQALSPPRAGADADVLLAAQINACTLALLVAGSVPMRGVVCAVAVVQTAATGTGQQPQPQVVGGSSSRRGPTACTGCFVFLFGVDRALVQGTGDSVLPPAKMIWTNFRANPGEMFSVGALADAEKAALEGAAVVWSRMKKSLKASSVAGGGHS